MLDHLRRCSTTVERGLRRPVCPARLVTSVSGLAADGLRDADGARAERDGTITATI